MYVYVCVYVCGGGGGGQSQGKSFDIQIETSHVWFFQCFSRRAGGEQLYQVERMIGGIGNMLFSIFSQT